MAGCGIRPSGGGSGPRGQRRRTADPTGRLPPGIWFQVWPAAIRPQTPAVPEAKGPPGFRRHRDAHAGAEAQTRHAAAAEDHPRGLVPGTRRINTPDPGRGSIRQGRLPLQTGSRSHAPAVVGAEERLASHLYTYPPTIVGGCHPCNRSVPKTQLEYGSLTRGLVWRWSVHDILPIVSGPVFMRKTRRGRDLEILARRSRPSTGES